MILVFVTFETEDHAEKVLNYIVDNHLAACAQYVPVKSIYFWKGKKVNTTEYESVIKTTEENFEKVKKVIEEKTEYEIPQIISVKAEKVNDSYLSWINSQVK